MTELATAGILCGAAVGVVGFAVLAAYALDRIVWWWTADD